jgi:8-oxo-dGTP pyrophosphatase MutT (NUDIX family)
VFPGGNLSAEQDDTIPGPDDVSRHKDGKAYRFAAIRECFEESGILLARRSDGQGLWDMPESEREAGRKAIHENQVSFKAWLSDHGAKPDIGKSSS